MACPPLRRGFSLIELSIVLVILGLLTGGILAGQSLIRASEMRAVSTEYSRYLTAAQTFRDKYFGIPGDFRDATRFWNRQTATSDCVSNSGLSAAGSPGVCDGDGNGGNGNAPAALQAGERFQFWRHLATAGLIEGTYTGLAGSAAANHSVLNSNIPASKLSNAGWSTVALGGTVYTSDTNSFQLVYNNIFQVGGQGATVATAKILKPEELWNIDTKMDDGRPAAGRIIAYWMACVTPDSGTNVSTNLNQSYNLDSSSIDCSMIIRDAY